jgi:hypothetical protein
MHILRTVVVTGLLAANLLAQTRPGPSGQGSTWLYYKDLPAAMRFYEDILGLGLTVDQGWAKVYQTSPTSFIGLVDEARGIKMRSAVADSKSLPIGGFTAYDPEGCTLEFETFRDDPQNAKMRAPLKAPK